MSTYNRQPGDLAIQIYVPRGVGIEIGKLRLTTRKNNNAILNELISEALVARSLLTPSEAPPKPQAKPAPKDTRTDAEKGFVFVDLTAPLDLSILNRPNEEEDPNPFAGLDLPDVA